MQIFTPSPILSFIECQICSSQIQAGFPSPADDVIDGKLDLNTHLIKHPAATFFMYASGNSMVEAGIDDGDLLIVDRALNVKTGLIVIGVVDGDFTVKRFHQEGDKVTLIAENKDHPNIEIEPEQDFHVWGVVKNVIKKLT